MDNISSLVIGPKYAIIALIFFVWGMGSLHGQGLNNGKKPEIQCGAPPVEGITNEGREFFLGMLYPSYNTIVNDALKSDFQVFAFITSYYDNEITVSYFNTAGIEDISLNYKIPARQTLELKLNVETMRTTDEKPQFASCHIISRSPVAIQYFSTGACSGGSYLALPVPGLGKKYVVASYNDNPGGGAYFGPGSGVSTFENSAGEFLVIATEDATTVVITPLATTTTGHIGVHTGTGANGTPHPFSVHLRRGESYLVRSEGVDESSDISGSLVEASKPVAVIAGHENAHIGGVGDLNLEARDFMIEQMIPAELWDSANFISIPMKEGSPPPPEGNGDNYRIYAYDATGVHVHADLAGINGGIEMTASQFNDPIPERLDVTVPVNFSTTDGKKISVMMYDQRSASDQFHQTAPSMMTILPKNRWKTVYNFYVPGTEPFSGMQDYYINVVDNPYATVSFNGGELKVLSSLNSAGNFNGLGYRYKLRPGTYCIKSSSFFPSMVYSYGMRAVSINSVLGDNAGDDFFFEYALPAGMKLCTGVKPQLSILIDTNCTGWHLCIRDESSTDPGIKEIMLIDDTDGVFFNEGNWHGKKSYNVHFDPSFDPLSYGDLELKSDESAPYCFDIMIADPRKGAFAYVAVIDNGGNARILSLYHEASPLKLSTFPFPSQKPDSLVFPSKKIGTQICTTLVLKNISDYNDPPVHILSARIGKKNSLFSVRSDLPRELYPYDSLLINVCFTSKDSMRYRDSLIVSTSCFDIPISLDAHGETGLINAENLDFGKVDSGSESCKNISIRNAGSASFTLTKSWLLSDKVNFSLDEQSAALLPAMILPGKGISLKICFHPKATGKNSARLDWGTDIDPAYADADKKYSLLSGEGTSAIIQSTYSSKSNLLSFSIYPNPASGNSVVCSFNESLQSNATLSIFDVLGREVYKQNVLSGISQLEIPIRNLSQGMYYVRLTSESGVMTQKMEVAR